VIAERQQIVRAALAALVSQMHGMRVVAQVANASELLSLLETVQPDVVIADLALPGLTGGAGIEQVRKRHPQLSVLAVSSDDTRATVQRVAAVGAGGYISRSSTPAELELALQNMATSGGHLPARAVLHLLSGASGPEEIDPLTPRQRQIAMLFAQGRSAKQIAFELGLSVRTVDVHRARIFHRLRVDGLAELTRDALRRGLIDP
jgi:DNA-binding NarL/FixJ family response regulator